MINLRELNKPPFEVVTKPKRRATADMPTLVAAVREILDEAVESSFGDDHVEMVLRFAAAQGSDSNLQIVIASADMLHEVHAMVDLAGRKVPHDPRTTDGAANLQHKTGTRGAGIHLGQTTPFEE